MGGHDAELILVAGALLAAGILGALLADRIRIPGLLLFLGLGMLAGSEGIGGIEFDNAELARTLGTIALVLILFEGGLTAGWSEIRPVLGTAASLATIGTAITAALARARRALDLRPQHARRDDRRRRDRRHRLGRDLRRAAPLDAEEAAGALARGRVGDERPGRPAARDRLHRMDPAARLRRSPTWPACWRSNWRSARRSGSPSAGSRCGRARTGARCRPTGSTRWRRSRSPGIAFGLAEVAHGSGLLAVYLTALALGSGPHPGPAHDRRLPRGSRLGRPDRPLHPARPARLPQHARRRRLRRPRPLGRADPGRPPVRRLRRHRLLAASTCASGRCSAGPACAGRRRSGSPPSRSSPGSAAAQQLFAIVFFVVVTSTLVQGATFEPLASRLGLTTDEPALPRRLLESGRIRRLGGDVVSYRLRPGAAAAGPPGARTGPAARGAGQRDRPRRPRDPAARLDRGARGRRAAHPRPRRAARGGRGADQALARRAGRRTAAAAPAADAAPRRSSRSGPAARSRIRRRRPRSTASRSPRCCAAAATAPAPWSPWPTAATRSPHEAAVAVGDRRALAHWCERRAQRVGDDPAERAWWQEVDRRADRRGRLGSAGCSGDLRVGGGRIGRRRRPPSRRRRGRRRRLRPSRRWRRRCRRRPRSSPCRPAASGARPCRASPR